MKMKGSEDEKIVFGMEAPEEMTNPAFEVNPLDEIISTDNDLAENLKPDGRIPRVKSNLKLHQDNLEMKLMDKKNMKHSQDKSEKIEESNGEKWIKLFIC